jgi:hypothetical protein
LIKEGRPSLESQHPDTPPLSNDPSIIEEKHGLTDFRNLVKKTPLWLVGKRMTPKPSIKMIRVENKKQKAKTESNVQAQREKQDSFEIPPALDLLYASNEALVRGVLL